MTGREAIGQKENSPVSTYTMCGEESVAPVKDGSLSSEH